MKTLTKHKTDIQLSDTEQENMLYGKIGELLQRSRNAAYKAVNTVMV
jgi:hypothetical protein